MSMATEKLQVPLPFEGSVNVTITKCDILPERVCRKIMAAIWW
jgi:hypothetical protein